MKESNASGAEFFFESQRSGDDVQHIVTQRPAFLLRVIAHFRRLVCGTANQKGGAVARLKVISYDISICNARWKGLALGFKVLARDLG